MGRVTKIVSLLNKTLTLYGDETRIEVRGTKFEARQNKHWASTFDISTTDTSFDNNKRGRLL